MRSVANAGSVSGLVAVAGSTNVTLGGATFTKADIGRVFNSTPGITNGTTVVAVSPNGRNAVISEPAVVGGGNIATVNSLNVTAGNKIIPGTFAAADVGAVVGVNNVGIPVGTVIEALDTTTPTSAVLSAAPTVTNATTGSITLTKRSAMTLFPAAPVLEGAYNLTIVSNGSVGADTADPDYQQTAVTSGSTFTVSSF